MDYKKIVSKYDSIADDYAASRIGKEDSDDIAAFAAFLPKGAKILDVGCAAGRDSQIFNSMGFDVVGVDLSEKLIAIARAQHPDIDFAVADILNLPFKSNEFDAIWASAILHHLNNEQILLALRGFAQKLKQDGYLYVLTKTAGSGSSAAINNRDNRDESDFNFVSSSDFTDLVSRAGFREVNLRIRPSKTRQNLEWLSVVYIKKIQ